MQSHAHPLFLLYLVAAAQGAFLLFALHYRERLRVSNQWAQTLFLGVLSYHILYFGLMWSGFLRHLPHLLYTGTIATAAIPVSWYFYQKKWAATKLHWMELLPLAWLVYLVINYLTSLQISTATKLEYYEQQVLAEQTHQNWAYLRNTGVVILQAVVYLLITRTLLKSTPQARQLYVWLVAFTALLIFHFTFCYLDTAGYALTYCLLVVLECLLVYRLTWSYIQPKTANLVVDNSEKQINTTATTLPTAPAPKYQKSNLGSTKTTQAAQQLTALMQRDQLFLQPDLRQTDLAAALNLSRHQLSELLTQELQTNYYDFVNRHRVEYAQKLLVEDKARSKTILAIAYEAGFNSKNAFNTAFKKFTGLTPSAYQRQHLSR